MRRLHEHTGGNPLYARALLTEYPRELADEPDGPLPVPRSYEAVVASRLDGRPPEARRLAEGTAGLISA